MRSVSGAPASILWKSADRAPEATEALNITAEHLKRLNLIDAVIEEPLGGAQRNSGQMAAELKIALLRMLEELNKLSLDELRERRYRRLLSYGTFKE